MDGPTALKFGNKKVNKGLSPGSQHAKHIIKALHLVSESLRTDLFYHSQAKGSGQGQSSSNNSRVLACDFVFPWPLILVCCIPAHTSPQNKI